MNPSRREQVAEQTDSRTDIDDGASGWEASDVAAQNPFEEDRLTEVRPKCRPIFMGGRPPPTIDSVFVKQLMAWGRNIHRVTSAGAGDRRALGATVAVAVDDFGEIDPDLIREGGDPRQHIAELVRDLRRCALAHRLR